MLDTSFKAKWAVRGGVALLAIGGAHSQAQAPQEFRALQQLQPGLWEFKSKDATANKSMCVTDMKAIFQLRHQGQLCKRYVITNDANMATAYYTCPTTGNAQTSIRVETPRLVQIQSQGLGADRSPFAFFAEGRRVSACSVRTTAAVR